MSQPSNEKDRQAMAWLNQFSQELDIDQNMLDTMPIEDVRAELQALGAEVKGFHTKLDGTLRRAKLKQAGSALIQWISPLWQPQWAGQFVGAGDIPTQQHTFRLEKGAIEVSCFWKPQSGDSPSYLDLSWKADTILEGEFWCRFVHPDTNVVLAEVPLGMSKEGGKYFTRQELGFDPSQEEWALAILVKPHVKRET
jgi:hypothetical protein